MPGLLETLEIRAGALRERLDARRRKEAEGQMGLDLSGSTKPAGGGEKCGQGWIDPNKTCRKGSGDAPYEARRSRPKETIVFPEPLVGPSGAKLRSYSWQWTLVEDVDARGEVVEKRVSDWEKSLANVETGRQVVHQFDVEVNGEIRTVSAESALKLMGYLSSGDAKPFTSLKSTARTVARLRMARAELDQLQERWEKEWQEVVAQPKPSASAGEWRQGNGDYNKRTWQMGDIKEEQIWNSNGKFTDQEMESSLVRQWHAERMRERGWDYKGERRGAMEAYVTRTRRDLERRLARAEAKLQARPTLDSLEATLARLDARIKQAPGQLALSFGSSGSKGKGKGTGQPCGDGWIPRDKTCHKSGSQTGKQLHPLLQEALRRKAEQAKAAKAPKPPAAIGPVAVSLAPDGSVLINGKPPKKSLGGGAYGDAFMADGPDGPVVVKVDRVTNADPMESNPDVPREQQRRNMVERELNNMRKAHELGLASEPLGTVQQLPDGRLAFAYRMIEGVKKAKDHRMMNMTPEATELMAQPGALANYARSVAVIARKMADAGFSHGDMHAGNMILSSDGSLNLVDWGYAAMRRPGSAAAIASEEANTLFILGGGMINVNSMVDRKLTGRGPKPDIIYALNDTISRARDAESAYRRIKSEYTKKWREDPANDLENPGKAIREANRLTREEGIPYDEAERRVGLEPPISPEVEAAAARERDRIFGSDRLRRFRRAVDRHYAAWNEFDW